MSESYPHEDGVVEVHMPSGAVTRIPTLCICQVREIYSWKVYNHHLSIEDLKDKIVFDIGAMAGVYSIMAAYAGASQVYAVEPNKANYALLQENVTLNKLTNITTLPMAISNQDNVEVKLFNHPRPGSHSITRFTDVKNFDMIPAITLDSMASEFKVTPDFIKMDIEGAEHIAMSGAKRLLQEGKTEFAIATYHGDKIHDIVVDHFEHFDYEVDVQGSGGQGGRFVHAWKD